MRRYDSADGGGPIGYGLVGEAHVQRVAVGLGVDRDRADPHLVAGADDAHRDLAAVGDEDLLERGGHLERDVAVLARRVRVALVLEQAQRRRSACGRVSAGSMTSST